MKASSRIKNFDLRADFGLFRDLLGRIPSEAALKSKGDQESSLIFKDIFLRMQE